MFTKFDSSKPRFHKLAQLQRELGEVNNCIEHGAVKYGDDNWKECKDNTRYANAAIRHLFAYLNGESIDNDSKLHHLAHAITNCLFMMWLDDSNKESLENE